MLTALRKLLATILKPSERGEDGYLWAVTGIGHVMLGAALQGLLGVVGVAARLLISIGYWIIKERGDLKRGGTLRDGLVDAMLLGYGAFYSGPRWWPLLLIAVIIAGAVIKQIKLAKAL